MTINATLINYLQLCHRKLWLHAHVIRMEQNSDTVTEGRLIGEESYPQRAQKNEQIEISHELDGILCTAKIDFFDAKKGIVYETKKSAAKEKAHVAQVLFYLYLLRKNGIEANQAILEYPKLRQTETVIFEKENEQLVESWIKAATEIIASEKCPALLPKNKCTGCSYFEFCWVTED
jgi:CRISPR-associated exonuclease Cas4